MAETTITAPDRIRIAAQATVDPRTVARMYSGERVTAHMRDRIERAAAALGLPAPPAPVDRPEERPNG